MARKTSKSNGNGTGNGTQETTATSKAAKLENGNAPKGAGKGGTVTTHGKTTTGYQRGCRCELCKAAMAAYSAKRKAASAPKAKVVRIPKSKKTAVAA